MLGMMQLAGIIDAIVCALENGPREDAGKKRV